MTLYAALVKLEGEWYVATREGKLLTTDGEWLTEEMPQIKVHVKCTVPTEDIFTPARSE